jgi:hypothetical protein
MWADIASSAELSGRSELTGQFNVEGFHDVSNHISPVYILKQLNFSTIVTGIIT